MAESRRFPMSLLSSPPTATPAETHNPPHGQAHPARSDSYLHSTYSPKVRGFHSWTVSPHRHARRNPQPAAGGQRCKRIQRLTVLHPLIRFPSVGHPFPPRTRPPKSRIRAGTAAPTPKRFPFARCLPTRPFPSVIP